MFRYFLYLHDLRKVLLRNRLYKNCFTFQDPLTFHIDKKKSSSDMQYYINALKDLDLSWITLTNITKVLAFIGIGLSKSYNLKNKQKK